METALALAFAKGVVGKLGEIVAEKALNEASLLFNFKSDFEWLEKQLSQLCASLQAADQVTGHTEPGVKNWVAEVRNIVFDAEDIVDECEVEHLYAYNTLSWLLNCCGLLNCCEIVFNCKMRKRIRELKGRIRSTIEEAGRLKLFHDVAHLSQPSTSTSTSTSGGEELRRPSIDPDQDSPAVAIDYKVDEILTLLQNPSIRVVAVLGMGGLGKTFLMQHVFHRIRHRYVYSAWISVSQSSSLRSLQNDLASHIGLDIDSRVSDVLALELIYDKLVGKRCLIVLDDVWSNSLISRIGFPVGGDNQCKIVVTTRSRDVAESMNAHVYEMQHLSKDESWNLFCSVAFPHCEGNRPPQKLEILARGIVQECGRLPLALKTVAASLTKPSLTSTDWESKLGQLKKIRKTEDFVMKILKLSYDSLPPTLKSCFACLSFFPEDTYISITRFIAKGAVHQEYVIYLWIAEGCIPQEEDREQFDTGLDYLHQLENLCLLEVNRVYSCYTVHDLLLDLAVDICKEHECEFDLPSKETKCRRLLLSKKSLDSNAISERPLRQQPFLRTLSLFQNFGITSIPEQLLDHARLLRVIDFSRTAISTLPKCVGNLKLHKVLNLSYTKIEEVPDCVRRLKSLQFLDVSFCKKLRSVPDWIGELNCLSYLDVQWCSDEVWRSHMPKGLSQLSSLRTLKSGWFRLDDAEDNEFVNVKDVGSLIHLREISFRLEDVGALRSVEDGALDRLVKMRNLAVRNKIRAREGDGEESSLPAFPEKLSVMKGLQQLAIRRFSVPNWIRGLENLTQLMLRECSDYSSLQKMPSLEFLSLDDDSICRGLPKKFGEKGGFPKLFKLQITNFSSLEELPALEEGAMQRLETLLIVNCPLVERVPDGLERLRRLKTIGVLGQRLEERLKEGGEDWSKIKAINPRIEIFLE